MNIQLKNGNQLYIDDAPVSQQFLEIWGATELGPQEREYVQEYGENFPHAGICHQIFAYLKMCHQVHQQETQKNFFLQMPFETTPLILHPAELCMMEKYCQHLYGSIPTNRAEEQENLFDFNYIKLNAEDAGTEMLEYLEDENYLMVLHTYIDWQVLNTKLSPGAEGEYLRLKEELHHVTSTEALDSVIFRKSFFIASFCPQAGKGIVDDFFDFWNEKYIPENLDVPFPANGNIPLDL